MNYTQINERDTHLIVCGVVVTMSLHVIVIKIY
jgi:hypothetical protein